MSDIERVCLFCGKKSTQGFTEWRWHIQLSHPASVQFLEFWADGVRIKKVPA